MKKFKTKAIALLLAVICLSTATLISAAGVMVPGTYDYLESETMEMSGTTGYAASYFTGFYYADGSGTNRAVITVDGRGGPAASFTTTATVALYDIRIPDNRVSDSINSAQAGSRYLELELSHPTDTITSGSMGYVTFHTASETYTSDGWRKDWSHRWISVQDGWGS